MAPKWPWFREIRPQDFSCYLGMKNKKPGAHLHHCAQWTNGGRQLSYRHTVSQINPFILKALSSAASVCGAPRTCGWVWRGPPGGGGEPPWQWCGVGPIPGRAPLCAVAVAGRRELRVPPVRLALRDGGQHVVPRWPRPGEEPIGPGSAGRGAMWEGAPRGHFDGTPILWWENSHAPPSEGHPNLSPPSGYRS